MSFENHVCQIADDFLAKDLHAECSCGWVGPQARDWHHAQADHAAHVHVAEGLAVAAEPASTPDGDTTP